MPALCSGRVESRDDRGRQTSARPGVRSRATGRQSLPDPLRTVTAFELHLQTVSEPRLPGDWLRSCPPERAAPVPPPLLRCASHPASSAGHHLRVRRVEIVKVQQAAPQRGAVWSEVKEESQAQPGSGERARTKTVRWTVCAWRAPGAPPPDMNGTRHPVAAPRGEPTPAARWLSTTAIGREREPEARESCPRCARVSARTRSAPHSLKASS
jgi:hypothetical protein